MGTLLLYGCAGQRAIGGSSPGVAVGTVVHGLRAALRAEFDSEEMVLTVEILNVSSEPRSFVPVKRWDEFLPGSISDSGGTAAQGKVVVRQLSGRPPDGFMLLSYGWHLDREMNVIMLQPDESRSYTLRYQLGPGEYEAQVVYDGLGKAIGDVENLETNVVRFVVLR